MNLKSQLRQMYPGATDAQIGILMQRPPTGVMIVADSKGDILVNWVGPMNKQLLISLLSSALSRVNSSLPNDVLPETGQPPSADEVSEEDDGDEDAGGEIEGDPGLHGLVGLPDQPNVPGVLNEELKD